MDLLFWNDRNTDMDCGLVECRGGVREGSSRCRKQRACLLTRISTGTAWSGSWWCKLCVFWEIAPAKSFRKVIKEYLHVHGLRKIVSWSDAAEAEGLSELTCFSSVHI